MKFTGPVLECIYVPNGKTICFNSIGLLETNDKEVIEHLSRLSDEGLYGISIVKGKKDVSEQKTSLEVNKSDKETIVNQPAVTEPVSMTPTDIVPALNEGEGTVEKTDVVDDSVKPETDETKVIVNDPKLNDSAKIDDSKSVTAKAVKSKDEVK